jgi:hypothetical protein
VSETPEEFRARVLASVMRDHPFEGLGQYCGHWSGGSRSGEFGTLTMGMRCGWSRETHPRPEGGTE